ncbi:MAG: sigma-70 family RNA polymerase sigma factor [Muribaculaceae bacterium]
MTTTNEPLNAAKQIDLRYIAAIKSGDARMTRDFFYSEIIGLLHKIRADVFGYKMDIDEMVNELYLYLSRDGWAKLDGFEAKNGCRLRSWMVPVAWRFFLSIRERMMTVDTEPPAEPAGDDHVRDDLRIQIAIDVNAVLARMPNRRYAEVLRLLLIEGYAAADVAEMLGVAVDNIYNIKHRAVAQFLQFYGQ